MNQSMGAVLAFICATTISFSAGGQGADPHGWLGTETLKTP
jgi:hypothetical protein